MATNHSSSDLSPAVDAIARLLLSLPFVLGGLQHLVRTEAVSARLGRGPLSFLATTLAPADALVVATGWLLIAGGLGVALGVLTRWAAIGSMALMTAISISALVGVPEEAGPLIKNMAIFGGLLVIAARGAGAWSVDARWRRAPGRAATVVALLLLSVGVVRADPASSAPAVEGPIALGAHDQAMRVGRFWIGGLLDAAALRQAKESGVQVVINLRDPGEPGWDESAAAADLGLPYHNTPIPKDEPFTRAAIDRVDAAVAAHPEAVILLHCTTGNRAAAWLAVYLIENQRLDVEPALAVARRAGLTKPETEAKVRTFVAHP